MSKVKNIGVTLRVPLHTQILGGRADLSSVTLQN